MKTIESYLPQSAQTGRKLIGVRGIVIHWVANPLSTALANIRYWKNMSNGVNAHDVIDLNGDLHHAVPYNVMCYQVGSKTYTRDALNRLSYYPNNCVVGIECTHLDWDGNMSPETYKTLVQHTANLCKKFKLGVDDIWLHQEVVGWKDCHRLFVRNAKTLWVKFLNEVKAILAGKVITVSRPIVKQDDIELVEYLDLGDRGSEVKEAQEDLKTLGFYKGEIDSIFGRGMLKAVEEFQKKSKLEADGVLGSKTQTEIEKALDKIQESKIWYRVRRSPNDAKTQLLATRDKAAGLSYAKEKKAYLLENTKVIYNPQETAPKPKAPVKKVTESKATKSIVPYPGSPLTVGSKGKDVERVQRAVGAEPDGIFGTGTKNKVKAYQTKHKLKPIDGIVGPATWAKMF